MNAIELTARALGPTKCLASAQEIPSDNRGGGMLQAGKLFGGLEEMHPAIEVTVQVSTT